MTRALKSELFWLAAAALIPLGIYLATLCRGIPVGDSAELAVAAANLQIAHPPGYPLLTLAGRIWTQLFFFLRPIVALNLFSAVCAAAAGAMLFKAAITLVESKSTQLRIVALALAVTFASGRTLWSVATNFEVYALAAFFAVAIIWLLIRLYSSGEPRILYLSAFSIGLSLCNHLSLICLIPAFLIVVISMRARLKLRDLITAGIFAIVPAGLYVYLLIRARFDLVLSWYNPQSWTGLKQQVLAESYQRFVVAPNLADLEPYLHRLAQQLGNEFFLPFALLAVIGFAIQWQRRRTIALMFLAIVLTNCALNFSYTISDIAPYFLPTIVVLVIWIFELFAWMISKSRPFALSAMIISVAIVLVTIFGNYQRSDLSQRTKSEQYVLDLFDRTPSGAMLFCGSDNSMFPALYLRYVENYRPDCGVYGHLPTLTHLQRDLGHQSDGNWTFFPALLKQAVASRQRPVILTRELMNFDTNYPRLLDNLIAKDLVYLVDSTLAIDSRSFRFDYENIPDIYDSKEALMYSVYLLAAAESAAALRDPDYQRYYNRAVKLVNSMNDPALSSSLAAYFTDRKEQRLAVAVIEPALQLNTVRLSERLQLLSGLGAMLLQLQKKDAAATAFEQMLALEPGNTEARFQLLAIQAADLAAKQEYPAAIAIYEQMEKLAPNQWQVTLQLALLYARTNNLASARAAAQRCIDAGYQSETAAALIRDLDSVKN